MNKPKVTLLIGSYQKPDLLKLTLSSYINQSYEDFQIMVFDDNHSDDEINIAATIAVVNSFNDKRILYFRNSTNIGVPFVFRKWISSVQTDYFYATGEGDLLLPNSLERLVEFLEGNPSSSMVYGLDIFTLSDGTQKKVPEQFKTDRIIDPKLLLESHLIGGPFGWSQTAALYRTELFKVWNIPVIHDHYWDFYFHCTYLLFSKKVGYINDYLCVRRTDSDFDGKLAKWFNENQFTDKIERLFQSSDFIDKFENMLISKKYNVLYFRWRITIRLIKSLQYCHSLNESQKVLRYIFHSMNIYLFFGFLSALLFPVVKILRSIKKLLI